MKIIKDTKARRHLKKGELKKNPDSFHVSTKYRGKEGFTVAMTLVEAKRKAEFLKDVGRKDIKIVEIIRLKHIK